MNHHDALVDVRATVQVTRELMAMMKVEAVHA